MGYGQQNLSSRHVIAFWISTALVLVGTGSLILNWSFTAPKDLLLGWITICKTAGFVWWSICGIAYDRNGWRVKGERKHWNWSHWMLPVICQTRLHTNPPRAHTHTRTQIIRPAVLISESIIRQMLIILWLFSLFDIIANVIYLLVLTVSWTKQDIWKCHSDF